MIVKPKLVIGTWCLVVVWLLFLGYWCLPARAWHITPELAQELAAKKAVVAKNPNDPAAQFDLAITDAYTNNLISGMSTLSKIPGLDPSFKQKALTLYINEVNARPNDWRLRFRLAFAYYFNEQRPEAIREFKNVLILDPDNVWAYGYLSLLCGEMGEIGQAMKWVQQGLAIDSNVAALHLLLAEGYYKQGDAWMGFRERVEALRLKALGY